MKPITSDWVDKPTTSKKLESNSDCKSPEAAAAFYCCECNVSFDEQSSHYDHIYQHVKQPVILLERVHLPPVKITFKINKDKHFEIVHSPTTPLIDSPSPVSNLAASPTDDGDNDDEIEDDDEAKGSFSPNLAVQEEEVAEEKPKPSDDAAPEYAVIPGGEPTPPPEPSPEYPKIRIKTSGLLKESLTITEITDDNPNGDPSIDQAPNWSSSSSCGLTDPLKLPNSDDHNIMSLFNNNDQRAKDLGFCTSDSEFISMDRLEDRNNGGVMQMYNGPTNSAPQSSLDSLTGLPMQALAQQVSRLQPSNGNLHQQNVLINIQQFPTAPNPQQYVPPPMYAHHPHPPQPMYAPFPQYQPQPAPIYYPPVAPPYPPQHMPPPQPPPLSQINQQNLNHQQHLHHQQQQQQAQQQHQNNQLMAQQNNHNPPQYRPQQMQQRPQMPRGPPPGSRMQMPQHRPPMGQQQQQRHPMQSRARGPMPRPRGVPPNMNMRGMPRMPQQRMAPMQNGGRMPIKRSPEQMQGLQAKRKRLDVLTPDKDDDDCQVIMMQPKNTDGGLPQIESIQGGTSESAENSIMHLSDSITLSVRNPPPKPVSPKKSDAKAVANILATRGITVTATAKPKNDNQQSKELPSLPTSLNLNGAVTIVPANKGNSNNNTSNSNKQSNDNLPTVDLTDDTSSQQKVAPKPNAPRPPAAGLPYRCDLCAAQYPNAAGLGKHRMNFHKTNSGMCDLGVPLINLKKPGMMQKLAMLGIQNYIPLPAAGSDGMFALPVISTRNPGNIGAIGATTMLSLGPVRLIPKVNTKPGNPSGDPNKM